VSSATWWQAAESLLADQLVMADLVAGFKVVGDLVGLPTGIWNCASSLGPTIAPPVLTVLMISFGWRWMFVSMGLLGIVVAIWFRAGGC
jgi:MFS family permease